MLASRPLLIRGEDFGFNAWSATVYDRDTDRLLVSLERFHAAVPTPFVAAGLLVIHPQSLAKVSRSRLPIPNRGKPASDHCRGRDDHR